MALIDGFVNDDKDIIHQVNKKAVQSAIILFLLLVCIAILLWALIKFAEQVGSWLFT